VVSIPVDDEGMRRPPHRLGVDAVRSRPPTSTGQRGPSAGARRCWTGRGPRGDRHRGRPTRFRATASPSAPSRARPDHVAHAGSASKTLAPGLRLGWLVAPPSLAAAIAGPRRRSTGHRRWTSSPSPSFWTGSLRPSDYGDVSRNASYLLGMLAAR
jgi:GntR family transcriptional regulator/MocR family aminotransferase